MKPPTVSWNPSHGIFVKKMPHRLAYKLIGWRHIFSLETLFPDGLACVNLTRQTNKQQQNLIGMVRIFMLQFTDQLKRMGIPRAG